MSIRFVKFEGIAIGRDEILRLHGPMDLEQQTALTSLLQEVALIPIDEAELEAWRERQCGSLIWRLAERFGLNEENHTIRPRGQARWWQRWRR